jgi:N-methylhydantoinase A
MATVSTYVDFSAKRGSSPCNLVCIVYRFLVSYFKLKHRMDSTFMQARHQIAVDIGGTFTDGVLVDRSSTTHGEPIVLAKALTTYDDPGRGVMDAIGILFEKARANDPAFDPGSVHRIVHGTTLVTNTLIARQGVRTALIVTSGTADCLDIRRELRYDTYDLFLEMPPPLVSPEDRYEVCGRLAADGSEIEPLDEDGVSAIADTIRAKGYQAVAVCLLHACTNDRHERAVEAILRDRLQDVFVSLSSDVAAEIGEYERMSTVSANAYVRPIVDTYLRILRDKFDAEGLSASLDIMMSDGAFSTADIARLYPIKLLESGPAGGVLSAINCAATERVDHILAFDMGGTTAKACVATGRTPAITHSFEFGRVRRFRKGSGLPAITPSIDLIEIGAGGGSVAAVDALGLLKVGPESAGSEPGPACYGRGGTAPTVTDADVILGYLDAESFLGGTMALDVTQAEKALASLGERLGLTSVETALGIHEVVGENMAAAARTHIAEKGLDARTFAMVATGGAGPVHAVDVAVRLGIRTVFCPIASGVGSCLGFLSAPARADRSWTNVERVADIDTVDLSDRIEGARRSLAAELKTCGLDAEVAIWELSAEVRYLGQGAQVEVRIPVDGLDPGALIALFEAEYAALFGHPVPGGVPEVVTWRLVGRSEPAIKNFDLAAARTSAHSATPMGTRALRLPSTGGFERVPVYDRYALPVGTRLNAPLIIQEPESTLVVGYHGDVSVTEALSIRVDLGGSDQ